jgi:hypothetical protein
MPSILLVDMSSSSMSSEVARKSGKLEVMTAPSSMGFKVELQVDAGILKAVAADPLVNQQMRDAVKAVYDTLVDDIGKNLQATDKGAVKLRDNNEADKMKKLVDVVNRGIVGARDVAVQRAEKEALACWAKLVAKRSEYRKYKVQIVSKITLGLAGLGVSIGLLAGGVVSFGASSIPGIVGMVKSVASVGSQLKSAYEEIETSQKRLEKNLKIIEERFIGARGQFTKTGKVQEVGVTLFAQFLGTTGPFAVVPSIKESVSALDVIKKKLVGVDVNTHDAAKDLNKILESLDAARKKFLDDVDKKLAKVPGPKAKADTKQIRDALDKELSPFISKVEEALKKIVEFQNRLKTAEPRVKVADVRVTELTKLKGVGWKVFENGLVFSDLVLSFADPGQYAKVSETLAGVLSAAGGLAADKITKRVFEGTFLE